MNKLLLVFFCIMSFMVFSGFISNNSTIDDHINSFDTAMLEIKGYGKTLRSISESVLSVYKDTSNFLSGVWQSVEDLFKGVDGLPVELPEGGGGGFGGGGGSSR